ncbi:hypothetical protein [Gemella sanguinis]|jgi:hypothetical protein|uniref:Uncharacterized protein n=1 Tax=Gemella sanguinis TaxID=84135 RepID=A0A2N6SHC6_9BACL|nr:hypothetical protein [Gemella sanguinis]PMC53323.1 hypothetical protein CJ218_01930 [Gemella sanguinis]
MIKRVIKIETTKEMVANDINELITGSDIDQVLLEENEYVVDVQVLNVNETIIALVKIGEK